MVKTAFWGNTLLFTCSVVGVELGKVFPPWRSSWNPCNKAGSTKNFLYTPKPSFGLIISVGTALFQASLKKSKFKSTLWEPIELLNKLVINPSKDTVGLPVFIDWIIGTNPSTLELWVSLELSKGINELYFFLLPRPVILDAVFLLALAPVFAAFWACVSPAFKKSNGIAIWAGATWLGSSTWPSSSSKFALNGDTFITSSTAGISVVSISTGFGKSLSAIANKSSGDSSGISLLGRASTIGAVKLAIDCFSIASFNVDTFFLLSILCFFNWVIDSAKLLPLTFFSILLKILSFCSCNISFLLAGSVALLNSFLSSSFVFWILPFSWYKPKFILVSPLVVL